MERISVTPGGEPIIGHAFAPVMSNDARWVTFVGFSPDLSVDSPQRDVKIYLRDRDHATNLYLAGDYACGEEHASSGDATVIVWQGYSNCQGGPGYFDVLLYDRTTGQAQILGDDEYDNSSPTVSRDGNWVAWSAQPTGTAGQFIAEMVLYEVATGETSIVPVGNAYRFSQTELSDDGSVISFSSNGQFYWYDRESDDLRRVSNNANGAPSDGTGWRLAMSGDGRFVVFESDATDLVENDENGVGDIFLYDSDTEELERISVAPDGSGADDESNYPAISANGRFIAFVSKARNLLAASTRGDWQVFVVDRELL